MERGAANEERKESALIARMGWGVRRRRGRPSGTVTALDLDGCVARVAQGVPKDTGATLTRVWSLPLELGGEADRSDAAGMGRALAAALKGASVRAGAVVMGIPRSQVVLRTLILPAASDLRDVASMVHFQVAKDLPFRMDEAVMDFKVRREVVDSRPVSGGEGAGEGQGVRKLEVLVAAVRREVVEFHRKVAEAAGLKLAALGLTSYANARCVEACIGASSEEQAYALVSLRPDEVNIDVVAQQSLLFSRGGGIKAAVTVGGSDATSSEISVGEAAGEGSGGVVNGDGGDRVEALASAAVIEVVRSLHVYSGLQEYLPVSRVVVSGASGLEEKVRAALESRLPITSSVLDPARALGLPEGMREAAAGGIAAIGLALGWADSKGLAFDFLNPKKPRVERDLRRIRMLGGMVMAAAVVFAVIGVRASLIRKRREVQAEASAALAEAEKKRPLYRRVIQQGAAVDEWIQGGRDWLDHVAYLSAVLPSSEEVYLTSVAVTGQGTIRLSVQATSGEVLAKMERQLRAAGYEVKPIAINPGADRNGYEFRSSVELVASPKLKIDLSRAKPPARPADDGSLDPAVRARRRG